MMSHLFRMRYGLWQPQCYAPQHSGVRITPKSKCMKFVPPIVVSPAVRIAAMDHSTMELECGDWIHSINDACAADGVLPANHCIVHYTRSSVTAYDESLKTVDNDVQEGDTVVVRCRLSIDKLFTGENRLALKVTDVMKKTTQ